jgi:hypothetical protein
MKKILFTTTTMFLLGTTAYAENNLQVNGSLDLFATSTSINDSDFNNEYYTNGNLSIQNTVENNGLTFGGLASAEVNDSDTFKLDEMYVFTKSSLGHLKFGKTEGSSSEYKNIPTSERGLLNMDEYEATLGDVPGSDLINMPNSKKSEKIAVRFNHEVFSLAGSYTPQHEYNNQNDYNDIVEVAGEYYVQMDGFNIAINGALGFGESETLQDYQSYKVGAKTQVDKFDFGLTYIDNEQYGLLKSDTTETDNNTITFGSGYQFNEQLYLSGNYSSAKEDKLNNSTERFSEDYHAIGVGVDFKVSENMTVGSDVLYYNDTASAQPDENTSKNDGISLVVGTSLNF